MVLKVEKESAKKQMKKSSKSTKVSSDSKTIKKEKKVKVEKTPEQKSKMAKRFNKLRLKSENADKRGIIYIGHLPRGFNEEELKKFFTQFGSVNKLRVSRSKKTGRSKGYAFLEFADKEVAKIAVGAVEGYLLFGKQIQAHIVEAPHRDTFKNGNREWKFVPRQEIFKNKHNRENKTDEQRAARVAGLLSKEKERRTRFKELGIVYEFSGF